MSSTAPLFPSVKWDDKWDVVHSPLLFSTAATCCRCCSTGLLLLLLSSCCCSDSTLCACGCVAWLRHLFYSFTFAFSPRFADSDDGDASGCWCCFLTCVRGRKDSDSLISWGWGTLLPLLSWVGMLVMFSEGLVKWRIWDSPVPPKQKQEQEEKEFLCGVRHWWDARENRSHFCGFSRMLASLMWSNRIRFDTSWTVQLHLVYRQGYSRRTSLLIRVCNLALRDFNRIASMQS